MVEFRSSWWSINLVPGWSAEHSAECTSFVRADGVGAFQISAHKYDGDVIPVAELDEFTHGELPEGIIPESITCGELSGFGVDYVAEGNFWFKRWLRKGPLLVYATYKLSDVQSMLATLQPVDARQQLAVTEDIDPRSQ